MSTYNTGIGHHQVLTSAVFARAEGNSVEDTQGQHYLDFYTNESLPFGHDVSILNQAFTPGLPVNIGLYENSQRRHLVDTLHALLPGYTNFQFNTSGTLANEGMLRYAMAITGRSRFAGFEGAFHGRSKALASVTDMDFYNGERIEGYFTLPYPGYDAHTRGSAAPRTRQADVGVDIDANLAEIGRRLDRAGAGTIAGVILEPILSKSVIKPPAGWLRRLKHEVLRPRGILMLADENFTSGRVGAWSSCVEQDAPADVIAFSKSFSSGYPFAGLACLQEHAEATGRVKGGDAGSAQAPQCRVVQLTIERLLAEDVIGHVQRLERRFLESAPALYRNPAVQRVSAHGALFGIEMMTKADAVAAGDACVRNGIMVAVVNRGLRLTPALSLSEDTLLEGLRRIRAALATN